MYCRSNNNSTLCSVAWDKTFATHNTCITVLLLLISNHTGFKTGNDCIEWHLCKAHTSTKGNSTLLTQSKSDLLVGSTLCLKKTGNIFVFFE